MSIKTSREQAELDFISVRRLLAEVSAKLHMADVIKDGLPCTAAFSISMPIFSAAARYGS
jgi:hypothetical protein